MSVLKHNWQIKLLSLAFAVILSVYVRGQQDRDRSTIYLPLIIDAPAGQRVVEPSAGTQVRVDLEGPAELIRSLDSEKVKMEVDTSGVQPGKTVRVPISVEIPERLSSQGVEAVWRPRSIGIKLISDATRRMAVEVQPIDQPEGWELTAAPQVTPAQVTISGDQRDISRVARVIAPIPLRPSERISETVTVQALDAEGRNITDQVRRIDPNQVLVSATQQRVLLQKDVPVQPVVQVPPGVRISARVEPRTVRLIGPARRLAGIYFVETQPFNMPPGRDSYTKQATLVPPSDDITLRPDRVKVILETRPPGAPAP